MMMSEQQSHPFWPSSSLASSCVLRLPNHHQSLMFLNQSPVQQAWAKRVSLVQLLNGCASLTRQMHYPERINIK